MSTKLTTRCFGRADFDTQESAHAVLQYVLRADPFAAERFGSLPPLQKGFSSATLPKAIELLANFADQERRWGGDIWLESRREPRVNYHVQWAYGIPARPFAVSSYRVDAASVKSEGRVAEWLNFCLPLMELHDAWFAAFCLDEEWDHRHYFPVRSRPTASHATGYLVETYDGNALEEGIPGVYWGTYFGSFYVDWLGRDKFEKLPCVEKRELPTGGIFFTTAGRPNEWNTPECQRRQRACKEILGADAFFDTQAVRDALAALPPLERPENVKLSMLQPPRRVPEYPFRDEFHRPKRTREQEIDLARRHFEAVGMTLESVEGDVLIFRDEQGGVTRIDIGGEGRIDTWPSGGG
jgi:hypothetical protein